MNRRSLLKAGAAAGVTASIANIPIFANNPLHLLGSNALNDDSILIIIQLFGGNDGLNTIIPADDPKYLEIRPNIAIRNDNANANLRPRRILNSDVFFHPALINGLHKNGFLGLMDEGRLAVIQGTGYENPNLSHFRSTDIWLSGFAGNSNDKALNSGWLGRYFSQQFPDFPAKLPAHPLSIQMGGTLSLALQVQEGDMGIAIGNPDDFIKNGVGYSVNEDALGPTNYVDEFNYVKAIAKKCEIYNDVIKNAYTKGIIAPGIDYTNKGSLATQMGIISKLISGGLQSKVYMAYLGGFDTHVQQQNIAGDGQHPILLSQLANAISLFMDDAVKQGFADRVVGLTVSEFGRRPYENGSNGTDHGTVSVNFAFGTKVQANVFGTTPNFSDLDQNGDFSYDMQRNVDYRRLYSEILETWFGATREESTDIFGERIVPLPYLQKPSTNIHDPIVNTGNGIYCSYDPVNINAAYLHFEIKKQSTILIQLYDSLGKFTSQVFNGNIEAGYHRLSMDLSNLNNGMYICEISSGTYRHTTSVFVRH